MYPPSGSATSPSTVTDYTTRYTTNKAYKQTTQLTAIAAKNRIMVPYDFFEAQDEAVRPAASRFDASAPLLTRRVQTSIAPAAAACINGVAPLLSTTSTRHLRFNNALTASRFPAAAAT